MKKRILSVFLIVAMCLSLFPTIALAAVTSSEYYITFTSNDQSRFETLFNQSMTFLNASDAKVESKFRYNIIYTGNYLTAQLKDYSEIVSVDVTVGSDTVNIPIGNFAGGATAGYVLGNSNSGIRYGTAGAAPGAIQIQLYKWTPTSDVTVTYNFANSGGTTYELFVPADNGNGAVRSPTHVENTDSGSKYILTATPSTYGYGFDHWEYSTEVEPGDDDWIIDETATAQGATAMVTITQDTAYRAVFSEYFFRVLSAYLRDLDVGHVALNRYGYQYHSVTTSVAAQFREGTPVALRLNIGAPHPVLLKANNKYPDYPILSIALQVYAGNGIDDGNLIWNEPIVPSAYDGTWGGFSSGSFGLSLKIPAMPYTENITVVFTTGGEEQKHYIVDTATIDISDYMFFDATRELRAQKLAGLETYYKETFGENPLGAENPPDALYDSFASVRYLLRDAYDSGMAAIRSADATEEAVNSAYTTAMTALDGYAVLNTAIKGGDGEAYKAYPGVLKIAVGGDEKPAFAYIMTLGSSAEADLPAFKGMSADKGRALKALEASLEAKNPGRWGIGYGGSDDPNIYITSIASGDGTRFSGSLNGGITYKYNDVWAPNGFSAQPVEDRGVIHIGASLNSGFLEGISSPNQAALIWALAVLRETYDDTILNANEAYVTAIARTAIWFPQGVDVEQTTPEQRAEFQRQIDELLASLTAEFGDVNLGQYDYPEEVIVAMNLIRAIGDITPLSGDDIAAARAAYNALEAENKSLIPNYSVLTEAEAAFSLLTAASSEYAAALSSVVAGLSDMQLTVSSMNGEWALIAALRSGAQPNLASYLGALNAQLNNGALDDVSRYTDYSRITLALSALGIDASAYITAGKTYDIVEKLMNYESVAQQGINGPVFALLALDSKPYVPDNTTIRNRYVQYILSAEIEGGGWSLDGVRPDPDMTAMTLQALAKHRGRAGVAEALARGLAALKSMQDTAHGGFYSMGQYNSESVSQVIVALTALEIDPTGTDWTVNTTHNPLTALLSFYDSKNIGFKHALNGSVNQMATEQAAYALAAYDRFVNKQPALYDMSDAFGGVSADKGDLLSAITTAQLLREPDYTPVSWGNFQSAIILAQGAYTDTEASQERIDSAKSALLAAIGNLVTAEITVPGTNSEILSAALTIKNALAEADYTSDTWAALDGAVTAANAIGPDAEQETIDAAASALLSAISALTRKENVDATLLNAAITEIELTQEDYTSDSWTQYNNALDFAQTESAALTAQDSVDLAAQSLITAIGGLIKTSGEDYNAVTAVLNAIKTTVSGDTRYTEGSLTALNNATEKSALVSALCALALKPLPPEMVTLDSAITAAALAESLYKPETWETLYTAVTSAQLKKAQGFHKGQDSVDADFTSIIAALNGLEHAERTSGGVNKALLDIYIAQAEQLNQSGYTEASWNALQSALENAKSVGTADTATQADIDTARGLLIAAIDALVTAVDKTALNEAIAQAEALNKSDYTFASWSEVAVKLEAAKTASGKTDATAQEVNGARNDLVYAIAALEKPMPVTPAQPPEPGTPTITVNFRLIGATPSNGDIDLKKDFGNWRDSGYQTWIATRSYTMYEGQTNYDLFKEALGAAGITAVGHENNYVRTIYAPRALGGYALSEFSNGSFSGWMYTVNGKHPGYGLKEQPLHDGDTVIWHYVNDYRFEVHDWFHEQKYPALGDASTWNKWLEAEDTDPSQGSVPTSPSAVKPDSSDETEENAESGETALGAGGGGSVVATETVTAEAKTENGKATATVAADAVAEAAAKAKEAVEAAKTNGDANAKAEVKIVAKADSGAEPIKSAEIDIPAEAFKAVAGAQDLVLTIESDVSTLTLDAAALAAIAENAEDGDTIKIAAEIGDDSVIDLNISVGGAAITDLGGEVTVSLPYTPEDTTAPDDFDLLTVYHLDDNGKTTEMKGARYDAAVKQMIFTTTHFSKFLISEWLSPFDDIAKGDWYYRAARYAYSNGLINGTADTTFAPQSTLTRAMLITILARDAGIDTDGGGTWYAKAADWGMATGLTDGTNMNAPITREQFATLLYRYAQFTTHNSQFTIAADTADLSAYTDANAISEYAREAMAWAVANGLITGRTATTLAPKGTATRAEAATLLQRYLENVG